MQTIPSAVPVELRREWIGELDAYDHLIDRGFEYDFRNWVWVAPPDQNPAAVDLRAIEFLHLGWGYPAEHELQMALRPPFGHRCH